jgi:hypothetical protein
MRVLMSFDKTGALPTGRQIAPLHPDALPAHLAALDAIHRVSRDTCYGVSTRVFARTLGSSS